MVGDVMTLIMDLMLRTLIQRFFMTHVASGRKLSKNGGSNT